MDELIQAIREQTEAINRLAESNEAIVGVILSGMDLPEDQDSPSEYLSAKKPA